MALETSGNWDDLKVRLASGAAMAAVGVGAIILGGVWFQMLAVFVTAVMVWECWIMIRGTSPTSGMLLAAARGFAACEMLAVCNLVRGRDDRIGCPVFSPLDTLEERVSGRPRDC